MAPDRPRSTRLLVGGVLLALLAGPAACDADSGSPRLTSADVATLLAARTRALQAHDATAFATLLDPTAASARAATTEFANLRMLPLGVGRYAETGPVQDGHAVVTLTYALAGFDAAPRTAVETDTFGRRNGRWLLSGVSPRTPEIWADGPLTVTTGARSLVLATWTTAGAPTALADEVDHDVPVVTAAWGTDWAQRAVVLLPATEAAAGDLAGESGELAQVAAVVTDARLVVNPTAYARLSAVGRRVTVTHELTHLASGAATTVSTPRWLVEGLADEVAFAAAGLTTAAITAELAADVRAGRVPSALPTDAAYAAGAPGLAATYEQGWLACRLIVERVGVAGLVAFYRAVGASGLPAPTAVDTALRHTLGEGTAAFTAQWLAAVRGLR